MLFKVTNTLYPKSHLNHTVNIQSGLGLSRVVGEKLDGVGPVAVSYTHLTLPTSDLV